MWPFDSSSTVPPLVAQWAAVASLILISAFGWLIFHSWVFARRPAAQAFINGLWIFLTAASVIFSVAQYGVSQSGSAAARDEIVAKRAVTAIAQQAKKAHGECKSPLSIEVSGKKRDLCDFLSGEDVNLEYMSNPEVRLTLVELLAYQENAPPDGFDAKTHVGIFSSLDFLGDSFRLDRGAPGTRSELVCAAIRKIPPDMDISPHPETDKRRMYNLMIFLCSEYERTSHVFEEILERRKRQIIVPPYLALGWFALYAFFAGARIATVTNVPGE